MHFDHFSEQTRRTHFFCYSPLLSQLQLKSFYCGKGRQNFASNVTLYPCQRSSQNYLVCSKSQETRAIICQNSRVDNKVTIFYSWDFLPVVSLSIHGLSVVGIEAAEIRPKVGQYWFIIKIFAIWLVPSHVQNPYWAQQRNWIAWQQWTMNNGEFIWHASLLTTVLGN